MNLIFSPNIEATILTKKLQKREKRRNIMRNKKLIHLLFHNCTILVSSRTYTSTFIIKKNYTSKCENQKYIKIWSIQKGEKERTFILLKDNILNLEMVSLKALIGGFFSSKTFLKKSEEDPSLFPGNRILQSPEEWSEGTVSSIAGLLAPFQEVFRWCTQSIHRHFWNIGEMSFLWGSTACVGECEKLNIVCVSKVLGGSLLKLPAYIGVFWVTSGINLLPCIVKMIFLEFFNKRIKK